MDLPSIIRNVQRSFGDDSQIFIRESDIINWANEAQDRIAKATDCTITTATVLATAFPWSFSATFLELKTILYNNIPLVMTSIEDLHEKASDLALQSTPLFYYFANQAVNIYPAAETTDTHNIVIAYAATPTLMTKVGDSLSVPAKYHWDIIRFCLARAKERNEDYRGYESAMSEFENKLGASSDNADNPDDTYLTIRQDVQSYYVMEPYG